MPKDTMILGGREVRVEVNWNALSAFLQYIGEDSYEGLANVAAMKPSQAPALMAAAINEGERLDGRESNLSPLDVGAIIKPKDVEAFMDIYVRQSAAQVEVDGAKKKTEVPEES